MSSGKKFLVVGAGFSGAVLARQLAEAIDAEIDVKEQREHIAGNCYTSRDPETDIMVHHFGPHIFNTSRKEVWEYIQKFGEFVPFVNRVKAVTSSGVYSMPVNLHTINQFFGTQLDPAAAQDLLHSKADETITDPANFEEQALRMMGRELYEAFFYGYTRKQWGCEPTELPASILKRLPMRFDYNDNYYHADFQAIPRDGYTSVVSKMLDHRRIRVSLSSRFDRDSATGYDHIFYTGPIDEYFAFKAGRLGYRTVTFIPFRGVGDHLGNAVLNYPEMGVPYTRVHEHKHFAPWEKHEKTIWFEEYSKETEADDVPFYPKRLAGDMAILKVYGEMAENESRTSFLGRLGTYRYLNMDHAIGEALDFSAAVIAAIKAGNKLPTLPTGVLL
jgi:UDP-galactopyranose mutase